MEIGDILFLGFIQGVTEFLPISSSGHLILAAHFLGMRVKTPILLYIFLHLATLVAILTFFYKQLKDQSLKLILAGLIPTFIIAIIIRQNLAFVFENTKLLSLFWLISGVWLLIGANNLAKKGGLKELSLRHAFLIGIAQGISALPGISRSGATLATAFILKIKREVAFSFSFILAIPTILAAFLYELLIQANSISMKTVEIYYLILVFFFTVIIGYLALLLLRFIINLARLELFAYYSLILAMIVFFFF
jgi:undecaprenyl-diphosphatase